MAVTSAMKPQSVPIYPESQIHWPLEQVPLPIQFLGQVGLPTVSQKSTGSGQFKIPLYPEIVMGPAALQVMAVVPHIIWIVVFNPVPWQVAFKQ